MKTINLAAGTTHVQYDELAKLIAYALWPDDGSMDVELFEMSRVGAEINLDAELRQAVTMERLPVKDPLTFGPHTFPLGRALNTSMVAIDDVRAFVADRGVTVVVEATQAKADTQPQAVTVEAALLANVPETREQRQDRRLKACEDAGLVMPKDSRGRLPAGVGRMADHEGVERQSFSPDVKAALKRREAIAKPGRVVHRT